MTLITDKAALRLRLEAMVGDLRHAYGFLSAGQLLPEGQRNVAGLVARQIRRIEEVLSMDDAQQRTSFKYFYCPFQCGYRTGTFGDHDASARLNLETHLKRLKHRLDHAKARELSLSVQSTDEQPSPTNAADRSTD